MWAQTGSSSTLNTHLCLGEGAYFYLRLDWTKFYFTRKKAEMFIQISSETVVAIQMTFELRGSSLEAPFFEQPKLDGHGRACVCLLPPGISRVNAEFSLRTAATADGEK